MRFAVHVALRVIRWACHEKYREELEGDLFELHARSLSRRGPFHAGLRVVLEALLAAHRRPSEAFMRRVRTLALAATGVTVAIAYLLLAARLAEPALISWPFVLVGTTLELLLWYLLFIAGGSHARRGG